MDHKIILQIDTLKLALSVGQKHITEIEERLKTKFEDLTTIDEQKEFLRNEAVYLYLKNFWQQYEFLIKKIETEDELKNFQFYIPLIRILFENYGEFLYFLNQGHKEQVGLYTGNFLLYLSDFYRFIGIGYAEIKNEYNRLVSLWNNVLSSDKIVFPTEIKDFTRQTIKSAGLAFPKFEQIFNKPYFADQSKETFAVWKKDSPLTFYDKYYRSHSNYTHPSFTNQSSGNTGNEVLWIVQFMYIMGQLMIELCNKKVFPGKFEKQYLELTEKINETYPKMLEVWLANKKK